MNVLSLKADNKGTISGLTAGAEYVAIEKTAGLETDLQPAAKMGGGATRQVFTAVESIAAPIIPEPVASETKVEAPASPKK